MQHLSDVTRVPVMLSSLAWKAVAFNFSMSKAISHPRARGFAHRGYLVDLSPHQDSLRGRRRSRPLENQGTDNIPRQPASALLSAAALLSTNRESGGGVDVVWQCADENTYVDG